VRKIIFIIVVFFVNGAAYAQLTYDNLFVDYDSAWKYKNLKIIPIRPKGGFGNQNSGVISLSQALARGLATVTERGTASTENVHFLRINNNSNKSLLISSGEVIAGGRQDRMVARDTILAPSGKDQYIPVMCVEENRWSEKEKKFVYSNFANPYLRKVLDQNKNQVLIWKEITSQLEQSGIKSISLAYLSRYADKKMTPYYDEYFKFFQQKFRNSDSSIVGFVAVSGDKVIGSDIYAGKDLFFSQLDPLLKGYIDGAILYGTPVSLPDDKVKEYMDQLLKNEKSQEEFVKYNGKIFRQNGEVIHINTF
jgi:hypothetical protein